MTTETQEQQWPSPKFYLMLDWGSTTNIPFEEVSGLEIDEEPIVDEEGYYMRTVEEKGKN